MAPGNRPADPASAARRAFRLIGWLVPLAVLAAIVASGAWLLAHRPDRVARTATPADEPADGIAGVVQRPRGDSPAPASDERAAPPSVPMADEATPAAPDEPSRGVEDAATPRGKRSDVSPTALAAERSRIALAELGPRQDRLVHSGEPASGAPPQWHSTADALRDELARSLIANTGVRVSGLKCFRAGCQFSVDAYDDAADVEARGRLKALLRGELAAPFPGESFVSGLVTRPDAYLRTTVLLYAPEAGASGPR